MEELLLAFANQQQAYLPQLTKELQDIRDVALANARLNGYLQVVERNGITYNTLSQLFNSLEGDNITMIHYSGHSSDQGLWVERDGQVNVIENEPLFRLIRGRDTIRLVFLNSCRSQVIADRLLKAGVAFVIGTSTKVKDLQAAQVARKFYEILGNAPRSIREAFRLTQDYFCDPLYNDDATLRQLFRGSLETEEDEFPWLLRSADSLSNETEEWTLIPKRRRPSPNETNELYQIGGVGTATDSSVRIMFSYARSDEWIKEEISKQLRVLYKSQLTVCWNDQSISDDEERRDRLKERLAETHLAIILTSADYLSSPFWSKIMGPLVEESYQTANLKVVIPFITKASNVQDDPFLGLWGSYPSDRQSFSRYGTLDTVAAKFSLLLQNTVTRIKATLIE